MTPSATPRSLLLALLSGINIILFLANGYEYSLLQQSNSKTYTYIGDDFPNAVPVPIASIPSVSYTFEESMRFQADNASLEAWYGNLARQFGYVRLGPERRIFAVSMHHQQHCLYFFARSLAERREPDDHTRHCLNYLRQNILCQADTTLEPPYWIMHVIEGSRVGAERVCHDWTRMYQFVEDNYWDWMSYREEHWQPG